jgi:putative acetyltransferase
MLTFNRTGTSITSFAGAAARQGVGSRLMDRIHSHAVSTGLTSLFSDVSITARPSFERWGFVVEKQQRLVLGEISLTNFRMRKDRIASKLSHSAET